MSWWLRCMLVACVTHGLDAAGALAGLRGNAHKRAAALDLADVQEAARLEDLFEVYSLRHARCATDADSACQYVLVTTNTVRGGLGNRLPSLVTGLLLALLTRRTLMLDFELYDEFFAHPLDFRWHSHVQQLEVRGHNLTYAVFEEQPPSGNVYAATDFAAAYADTSVLHILQDRDYQGAVLAGNPHYRAFMREWFPTGSVFHPLAHWLLRLSQPLRARVHAHARRHFTPHTIGIHMRLLKGGEPGTIYASWTPPPSVEAYAAAASALAASYGPNAAVHFFVSGDHPEAFGRVAELLGADAVSFGAGQGKDLAETTAAGNPGTEAGAMTDLALLVECRDVVVTTGSSFGGVAAAWGGMAPVYLLHGEHGNIQNPFFWRALSPEPCFWGARDFLAHASPTDVAGFKRSGLWLQYTQCH